MGNIEKPLTWVLVIASLGLLFLANYDNLEVRLENGGDGNYGISISENEVEIKEANQSEDMSLNIDSIVDAVLEDIDREGKIDTAIKIDLSEENTEK